MNRQAGTRGELLPRVETQEGPQAGLNRRRKASQRCPPLEDGRRDPLDTSPAGFSVAPVVMGLAPQELLAEAKRLERTGWALWELRKRLGAAWCGGDRP